MRVITHELLLAGSGPRGQVSAPWLRTISSHVSAERTPACSKDLHIPVMQFRPPPTEFHQSEDHERINFPRPNGPKCVYCRFTGTNPTPKELKTPKPKTILSRALQISQQTKHMSGYTLTPVTGWHYMCTDIKAISKSNVCAANPTSADDKNPADHVASYYPT